MSTPPNKDASANCFAIKEMNESSITFDGSSSLTPVIEIKQEQSPTANQIKLESPAVENYLEPSTMEIEITPETPTIQIKQEAITVEPVNESSPVKQKRKYVRKPKAEGEVPERKPRNKGRLPKSVSLGNGNDASTSVSSITLDVSTLSVTDSLNSSYNDNTSMEISDAIPKLSDINPVVNKFKRKTTTVKRKTKSANASFTESGEGILATPACAASSVEAGSVSGGNQVPAVNNVNMLNFNTSVKKRPKGRPRKIKVEEVALNTGIISSVVVEPIGEGHSTTINVPGETSTVIVKNEANENDATNIVNTTLGKTVKPRRSYTPRKAQLLLFSEMPSRPIDETERKVMNKLGRKKIQREETADDNSKNNAASASDSDLSEIDGNDIDRQFWANKSSENVPFTADSEKKVIDVIENVSQGEGEINPNPVLIAHPRKRRNRISRAEAIGMPRRTSQRISQEFRCLIEVEKNERFPIFQDSVNESCSVISSAVNRNNDGDSDSSDQEEVLDFSADNCSLCKWKINPVTPEEMQEDFNLRKSHKFSYTGEEKFQLYADGEFLVDDYLLMQARKIEKRRDEEVLWRVMDSYKFVQRFEPIEVNGRVFHHGTDHYHVFEEKSQDFYQRFQPVYAVPILDNKEYQIAIFFSVDRIHPVLPMLCKTDYLFDAYKVVIQMMISANLELHFIKKQLTEEGGDIYFSQYWETIASVIDTKTKEISNAEFWAPGVCDMLSNFPKLIFSKLVTSERNQCSSCRNRERKAVFLIKFMGGPYDKETFDPLQVPESARNFTICYYCQPLIKSFIRLYHHRYLLFYCMQKNISIEVSKLKEGEKYEGYQLLDNMMEDHEWILNLFLEFQVVLADADKSLSQLLVDSNKPRSIRKPNK